MIFRNIKQPFLLRIALSVKDFLATCHTSFHVVLVLSTVTLGSVTGAKVEGRTSEADGANSSSSKKFCSDKNDRW